MLRLQGRLDEAGELEARARAVEATGQLSPAPEEPDGTRERYAVPRRAPSWEPNLGEPDADAAYMQGLASLAEGKFDQAEACLREAIRLDATMADAWVALAAVQAERGQIELSCQSARTALAIRSDLAEPYWRLATNLLGDVPDADVEAMEKLATGRVAVQRRPCLAALRPGGGHEPARALCSKPPRTSTSPTCISPPASSNAA